MRRIAVRNLVAHKLRTALISLAVIIGVALVGGALVLGDTMNRTFDSLFGTAYAGTDVGVRGKTAFSVSVSDGGDPSQSRPPVPASVLETVKEVDGVAAAIGDTSGFAQIVDPGGEVVETSGAPTIGGTWLGSSRLNPYRLVRGQAPDAAGEVVVDDATAQDHDIAPGDRVKVLTTKGVLDETVTGIVAFGHGGSLAGATVTLFDPATSQQLLGTPGTYSEVLAAGDGSVPDAELRDRVGGAIPAGYVALTGEQLADEDSGTIKDQLKFVTIFLLVFGILAVFVGGFIILNAFTVVVAQRTRELALLRALGAGRGQVIRSVLTEAIGVGFVGSTAGLASGVGLARLLRWLISVFFGDMPGGGLVLLPRTVVWCYLVGMVVTVVAASLPAMRATRIPPVAAMREDVLVPASTLHRRAVAGTVFTVIGVAAMVGGLAGGPFLLVGVGVLLLFVGVALLNALISRPVVRLLGAGYPRMYGAVGLLSRENALRSPRRTAATASALMVGLAVVAVMGVFAASISASANRIIDRSVGADFIVTTQNFSPIAGGVAQSMRRIDGVEAVTSFRSGQAQVKGSVQTLQGVSPDTVDRTLQLDIVDGDLGALEGDELLVNQKVADSDHLQVGQSVPVTFGRTGKQTLTVGGIYADNQIAGNYLIGLPTFDRNFTSHLDQVVAMTVSPDADVDQVRTDIRRALGPSTNLKVRDQSEFKAEQRRQINRLLGFVIVLLVLVVVIAALGILITLMLSVVERTREIGLLRAVGMLRPQVRRMVRLESVVISVFGTLVGLVLGVVIGSSVVKALADEGLDVLAMPVLLLASSILASVVIGVVAGLLPAYRAGQMDVLRAVTTE